MKIPPFIHKPTIHAFTLPEVVIAVAIAGLGLVSLLGLMPQSLDTLRKAGEVSAEARIAQQIFASISMSDWQDAKGADQLSAGYDKKRYCFDDLAVELDEPGAEFGVAYVAEVEVPDSDVALPGGGSASNTPDPHLRRVTVKVATTPVPDFDFENARAGAFRTYASVISRLGK